VVPAATLGAGQVSLATEYANAVKDYGTKVTSLFAQDPVTKQLLPTTLMYPWLHDLVILRKDHVAVVQNTEPGKRFPAMTFAYYDTKALAAVNYNWEVAGGGSGLADFETIAGSVGQLISVLEKEGYRIVRSNVFVEAGDIISTRDAQGRTVILIGEHSILTTLSYMHHLGFFEAPAIQAQLSLISQQLRAFSIIEFDDFMTMLSQASAYVNSNYRSLPAREFFPVSVVLGKPVETFLGYYFNRPLVAPNFSTLTDTQRQDAVYTFIGKRTFAKHFIANELGVPDELKEARIIIVPNPLHHIGNFIRPGDKGILFMQNPDDLTLAEPGNADYDPVGMQARLIEAENTINEHVARFGLDLKVVRVSNAVRVGRNALQHKVLTRNFLNGHMGTAGLSCNKRNWRYYVTSSSGNPQEEAAFATQLKPYRITPHFLQSAAEMSTLSMGGAECAAVAIPAPVTK